MKLINPKKNLGQNFLTDKNIINIIVHQGDISKKDIILEVGPGTGSLTEKILSKNPKKIFAIEKDKYLSKDLNNKFKEKVIVINDDILKFDEKFGEEVTPAATRVQKFLEKLLELNLITLIK